MIFKVEELLICLVYLGEVLLAGVAGNRLLDFKTTDNFLNTCMQGKYHKKQPGPEPDLHKQCYPWKKRACCHGNTSEALHYSDRWYNFDWDHCPGHKMSGKCRRHFIQDLCFYECSPNLGPWLVQTNRKASSERGVKVPLCRSQCEAWWIDCKEEFTCRDNWGMGFDWTTGVNKCPEGGARCATYEHHFKNSTKFCEQIWDFAWKVVPDSPTCMHMWFETGSNPNDAIAKSRAEYIVQRINSSRGSSSSVFVYILCLIFCVVLRR